ncbi:alpha/beta fold hydrolase [Paludibacterium purpuratum]|uniref:Pimeloyl-ACP methyl ester carboxylesterase n=1 Tax=Paludibacterium purpuratum TaxID=1144873 RepID=A0A4R7BBI4_9NEIS|nr:alpha/beta hydrolase [Paludibacterium purpuratum]TDR82013.1 pimeloyl-ACP methyl ester carboxylesterase [Paludibacterium purpuratum]
MTDHLYFAHANSFPASVYHKMLGALSEHYTVSYTDCIGHDPAYPITDCWPRLVDQTIASVERLGVGPVWAVGHSLGGILVLYAAVRRPDLFKGLAILDSPLFSRWRALTIWFAKRAGFIDRITPGGNTLKRRNCWASTEMVHEYFGRKPMFARFDPDCLWDYARHGTVDDGQGGRQLKFHPTIEHRIYVTLPHDIAHCADNNRVPGIYLAAGEHPVLTARDQHYVRDRLGLTVGSHPGSHLFPLEQPLSTAERIRLAFTAIETGAGVDTSTDRPK